MGDEREEVGFQFLDLDQHFVPALVVPALLVLADEAIRNAEKSIIDADYGRGVIKQRIARANEGESGGYRSIILFRKRELSFFVYGFAKSELGNIDASDERDFKELAKTILAVSEAELKALVDSGNYTEVKYDD